MSGHAQPAEKSSLAIVKRSTLVVLDAFDTASAAFVGKFLKPSVDEIYDNKKRQVNSFGQTSGYKRDYEQLVPKPVAATTTEWHEGSATRAVKTKNQASQQQMTVVAAHARPHAARGRGAGQRPPATAVIAAVVAFP